MMNNNFKQTIDALVATAVESFAAGFQSRHEAERNNPNGKINSKIHNVFIEALGKDIQYYSALVRSLDSSLGNMLEALAINIAKLNYEVHQEVEGPLYPEQTNQIASLLEKYKSHAKKPRIGDYQFLRKIQTPEKIIKKRHDSDYFLVDKDTGDKYLIELKIGGDLDNKKARSEKEALLEQFCILSNVEEREVPIKIFFATAYNRLGEDSPWIQGRVQMFFADKELLIGRDFWNFLCKSDEGYQAVITSYRNHAHFIRDALDYIKRVYLNDEQ